MFSYPFNEKPTVRAMFIADYLQPRVVVRGGEGTYRFLCYGPQALLVTGPAGTETVLPGETIDITVAAGSDFTVAAFGGYSGAPLRCFGEFYRLTD